MKGNFDREHVLQILTILMCLTILTIHFSTENSSAQACQPNNPPPRFPADPPYGGWDQGESVSVVVFDRADNQPTTDDEFNAIDAGMQSWNSIKVLGCSQVTILPASRAGSGYHNEVPPENTIYVVRTTEMV